MRSPVPGKEEGLRGAPRARFLHSDRLARAGRGVFRGSGDSGARRQESLGLKGRSFTAPEMLGRGVGPAFPLQVASVCVCTHVCGRRRELPSPPPPFFFLQAGATFSPTSSGVTLIRLLRRLMHWRKTQLEATPRSRGFPQRSAEQGSAARVWIAGCWAGEAGLASPTSRGARAPSPSPAALWKAPPSRLPSAAARLLLSLKGAGSGRARSGVL